METNITGKVVTTHKVPEKLHGIGIVELLEHDQRPTFVPDLDNALDGDNERLKVLFCNAALLSHPVIILSVHQAGNESWQSSEFKQWAIGFPNHNYLTDGHLPTIFYHGLLWTCSTLRRRWRIIIGRGTRVQTSPLRICPKRLTTHCLEFHNKVRRPPKPIAQRNVGDI